IHCHNSDMPFNVSSLFPLMSKLTANSTFIGKTTFTAFGQPRPGDEWIHVTIFVYADTIGGADVNDIVYASGKAVWLNSHLHVSVCSSCQLLSTRPAVCQLPSTRLQLPTALNALQLPTAPSSFPHKILIPVILIVNFDQPVNRPSHSHS